ncbi:MAG: hypothetical protein K5657_03100 [Desulfovibrio sp.]|nr:hypothetical protein [Desulfovibrio sp.]
MQKEYETISLTQDNGKELTFRGSLYSECSWFDDDTNQLTKQKLYVTDTNEQVYYIVRSSGEEKIHHAYRFTVNGDNCVINNGKSSVTLPFDMLMHVVRNLCGLTDSDTPQLSEVEELNASHG